MKRQWMAIVCVILCGCMNLDTSEMYMKPGALDTPVSRPYVRYQYKFLKKYQITHDFVMGGGCHYRGKPIGIKDVLPGQNYAPFAAEEIFEVGAHTYVDVYSKNSSAPMSMDRYLLAEWQMGPNGQGNFVTVKGFSSMCFETWGGTSHVLAIKLFKKDVATWKGELEKINPAGKFNEEVIGKNTWLVQCNEIAERHVNTVGGAYLHYTTPIGDSGYTLTIQLGANQDSLKHPEAHARMQEIFRHLVESVKIEPIAANAK